MEEIIVKKSQEFNLKDTLECGQCFRWQKNDDGNYFGIVKSVVIKVIETPEFIRFQVFGDNIDEQKARKIINEYFDLERNYKKIKSELIKIEPSLKQCIKCGDGIRILNQDLWETIISYIISANNNIPRIKGIIEKISKKYGDKIIIDNEEFYTFPTPQQLSKASIADLRKLGLGFRDERIYNTTQMIINKKINLEDLSEMNTEQLKEVLQSLPGVGPKVANCILLFSTLKRTEVFPVDIWILRAMNELYIHNQDEKKVNKKEVEKLGNQKFGNMAGIAQQYLYYWKITKGSEI